MTVVEEIAGIIEAQGLATRAVDLFLDLLPDTPDAASAIVQYAGSAPSYVHDKLGVNIEYPLIQVTTRATTSAQAWATIEAIYRAVARVVNQDRILRVEPQSMPFLIYRDANSRPVYAFNMQVTRGA